MNLFLSHISQHTVYTISGIRPYFDSTTASTIAASIVHFPYLTIVTLYNNLPESQVNRLRQIQNFHTRTGF